MNVSIQIKGLACAALVLTLAGCVDVQAPSALRYGDYPHLLATSDRPAADLKDDAARKPADVLDFARIRPGDTILEMEVGRGWYTEILSVAVGPRGHIITQNPAEFDYSAPALAVRRKAGHLKNVTDTTSHFDDLKVPSGSVDKVLWILGPHELYYIPKGSKGLGDHLIARVGEAVGHALDPGGDAVDLLDQHKAAAARIAIRKA